METNTKDNGLNMISVKRNPARENYAGKRNPARENYVKKRNAGPERAEYRSRGQRSGRVRTQAGINSRRLYDPRRARAVKRRQRLRIQCIAVSLGLIAFAVLGVSMFVKHNRAAAATGGQKFAMGSGTGAGGAAGNGTDTGNGIVSVPGGAGQPTAVAIQGIPAEQFAAHPEWEENFLTPNEYSRPGDELKEVKNIFVHYTANPGTSAAQNRSYFERQKDEHLASVSSHFIIGYDGEIIQCVPLTEIAYAVQTRNFDSVSIECCYKAKDGSFTQETYQSLISLLAWLTDVYDLDTEDILRHYDCGGKKCPLYYTNHADKWKQLKEDVKTMKENTGVKL